MNYPEAITKLRDNHIYPTNQVEIGKDKKEKIIGLEVSCNSFTVDSKKEVVEKVLGSGWKLDYMPNDLILLITKK